MTATKINVKESRHSFVLFSNENDVVGNEKQRDEPSQNQRYSTTVKYTIPAQHAFVKLQYRNVTCGLWRLVIHYGFIISHRVRFVHKLNGNLLVAIVTDSLRSCFHEAMVGVNCLHNSRHYVCARACKCFLHFFHHHCIT